MKIKPNWQFIISFIGVALVTLWAIGTEMFGPVFGVPPLIVVALALCIRTEPSLLDIVRSKTRKDWPLLHTLSDKELEGLHVFWYDQWINSERDTEHEHYAWLRYHRLDIAFRERRMARRLRERGL